MNATRRKQGNRAEKNDREFSDRRTMTMMQFLILMIIAAFFLLTIIVAADEWSITTSVSASTTTTTTTTTTTNEHAADDDDSTTIDDNDDDSIPYGLLKLNDGNYIPQIGLGVALTGSKTYESVTYALQHVGYRLFDTASEESYNNEDQVGNAIYDYLSLELEENENNNENHPSSDNSNIFVTTKLWDTDHGFYNTIKAFMISYRELNLQNIRNKTRKLKPIDMYLMHSPYGGRILETYDAMLYIQSHGHGTTANYSPILLKSIGVSNFDIRHLEVIRKNNRPMPTINQIEMHPLVYKQRKKLIDYCHKHQIQIQAFGSLVHGYSQFIGEHTPQFLSDMVQRYNSNGIKYIVYNGNENNNNNNNNNNETTAQQQQKQQITTAHILLQWARQHKFAIIPKSSRKDRIQNNVRYIDLGQQGSGGISGSGSGSGSGIGRDDNDNARTNSIEFILLDNDMKLLNEWGDSVPYQYRNVYKRDWNWNPIDEAPVHIGRKTYYDTRNNVFDVDEDKIGFALNTIDSNDFDFDILDYDDEDYDDDGYFNNNHNHEDYGDGDDDDDEEEEIRSQNNES